MNSGEMLVWKRLLRETANEIVDALRPTSDTERLNQIERIVRSEGGRFLIHDNKSMNCLGLTIHNRSLREAIDETFPKQ